jgi:hypothetical protein
MRGDLVVLFSAVAAALACGEPAAAAVRLCKEPVSSGLIVRPTELEARKEAMTAWKAKAMEFGELYAGWGVALDRLFECLPHKDGGFECMATGRPCTIEHAPDRRHLRENRIDM